MRKRREKDMRWMKSRLAILLAVLLAMLSLPVSAEESFPIEEEEISPMEMEETIECSYDNDISRDTETAVEENQAEEQVLSDADVADGIIASGKYGILSG